jgi:hypothetical protein
VSYFSAGGVLACAGVLTLPVGLMDKKTPVYPPITNAADYVDALTRPRSKDLVLRKTIIAGRRMRDKYLEEVVVTEVMKRLG